MKMYFFEWIDLIGDQVKKNKFCSKKYIDKNGNKCSVALLLGDKANMLDENIFMFRKLGSNLQNMCIKRLRVSGITQNEIIELIGNMQAITDSANIDSSFRTCLYYSIRVEALLKTLEYIKQQIDPLHYVIYDHKGAIAYLSACREQIMLGE